MIRGRRVGLLGGALFVLLIWLIVYPLVLVLLGGFHGPEGWTLDYVRLFLHRRNEAYALWGSLWISLATVALAGAIGIPLAFLFWRYDFAGRRILGALVALPAVLPPLVGVIAFLFLYGESGFASLLVQRLLGLEQPPWRLQGAGAILLVHAYSMYVYFYLFTRAGLASLDAAVFEAAASLGAGRVRTLQRVVLPLLYPSLGAGALLTFMTALASFSAPYIFGGGFRVMTTQIVATRLNGDDQLAMIETVSLTLVALASLWLLRGTRGVESPAGGRKGVAPALVPIRRPAVRVAIAVVGWSLALVLLLPHLTLLLVSFVPAGTWTTEPVPPAYTWRNYLTLIQDPVRARPLLNSLWLASAATIAAVLIAVIAGIVSVRRRERVGGAIQGLLALPWAVPGTVFAIALATAFSVHAPLAGRFILVGTLWILPLAYLVRNLPITSRAVLAGFRALDPALDEAAATLGAGRWRTLRRVTLPLLRPALVAGASLAFVTAFGDFVTSVMLYTYDTRPISMEILSSLRQSDVGVAAAYGVVLMAVSAAVFAVGAERRNAG
ncbi:MAG TPA: iron ABC transporter permease [Gemmatimonadales bacterium]|jgi:iron(III) transport system permease protein|nr:iron ABC transporter permease [Gemmatimonadales bacterium]